MITNFARLREYAALARAFVGYIDDHTSLDLRRRLEMTRPFVQSWDIRPLR